MKRLFLAAAALFTVAVSAAAQGKIESYDLGDFTLHTYTSSEAMGDVSILVEGAKGLVVVEPQSFYKSIEDFNSFASSLGKPIELYLASYHAGGLAQCDPKKVVMVEPMVEFMKSPMAQGMMSKFADIFQGAMDTRMVKIKRTVAAESSHKWVGVDFKLSKGAASDFPASSINIGGKAYYTHFAPSKAHIAPMRIKDEQSIDAILSDLRMIQQSGVEHIFGSHGAPATLAEVSFMIEYLETMKRLVAQCSNGDIFAQRFVAIYPTLQGVEGVKSIAKALYPLDQRGDEELAVRQRVQDYFDMVSNLDTTIAKGLWAERGDISIITPRSHFFGYDNIMNDFLIKTFSSMQSRKLHSLSEVVNIYGTSANVQLYWIFDTIDAAGESHQTRGRESLIFEKIEGVWRLVHVHYSRLP